MKITVLVSMILVSACSSPRTRLEMFHEQEFRKVDRTGSGAVTGRVRVTHEGAWGAEDVTPSGAVVDLVPANAYTREWFEQGILGTESLEPEDPRLAADRRKTKTDSLGRFSFTGLPTGEFYLTSRVHYIAEDLVDPDGSTGGFSTLAKARVSIVDGFVTENVVVTQ